MNSDLHPCLSGDVTPQNTKRGEEYRKSSRELLPVSSTLRSYKAELDQKLSQNPYGVPIAIGTWGWASQVTELATAIYFLHKAFPEIVGPEYTLRGRDYVLGVHPVSNLSYVSGVGTESKLIAYGNNRADYTFIPGGMIPGVVIIQPDFPELKSDWPFLWYENEYVVDCCEFLHSGSRCRDQRNGGEEAINEQAISNDVYLIDGSLPNWTLAVQPCTVSSSFRSCQVTGDLHDQ